MLLWTRNLLRWDGIDGYEKISLDEILYISKKNEGKLNFIFPRQIGPHDMETKLALLKIKWTIDNYLDEVEEVNLYTLQWGDDKLSLGNNEKRAFVELQTLDGEKYYIAVQSKSQLKKNIKIRDVYLDIDKIREMVKKPGLEYMGEPLDYLIQNEKVTKIKVNTEKGEVIKDAVNILYYWGVRTLYYIGEVSKHIFGIKEYEVKEFKDNIKLANGHEYNISGYESTFEYKGKELRFGIFDASHIYEGEDKKYREKNEEYKEEKINSYIALAVLSGSGYILLEEDFGKSSVDEKIREFIRKAKKITGYDILTLVVDEQKLIERGIIGKEDYVKIIRKNEIPYIIDNIRYTYGI